MHETSFTQRDTRMRVGTFEQRAQIAAQATRDGVRPCSLRGALSSFLHPCSPLFHLFIFHPRLPPMALTAVICEASKAGPEHPASPVVVALLGARSRTVNAPLPWDTTATGKQQGWVQDGR
jgi:hypothetical protein